MGDTPRVIPRRISPQALAEYEGPEEVKVESQGASQDGRSEGSALLRLVDFIYNTPPERLAELTNIPLDLVRTMTMMSTFIKECEALCYEMRDAQVAYNEIYKEYHKKSVSIDVDVSPDYNVAQIEFIEEAYLFFFYQLRRSVNGDNYIGAIKLAEAQINSQVEDNSGEMMKYLREG